MDESLEYNIRCKRNSKNYIQQIPYIFSAKTKINVWTCVCKHTPMLFRNKYKSKTILSWKQEKDELRIQGEN